MAILKVIRPLKVNGEILRPGEMFRTSNVWEVIDKGYARPLTKDEAGTVLDEYGREVKRVFNKKIATRPLREYVQGNLI